MTWVDGVAATLAFLAQPMAADPGRRDAYVEVLIKQLAERAGAALYGDALRAAAPLVEMCIRDSIMQFTSRDEGGYLVITAPPGFGKTALMANLVAATPEAFAYHFFAPVYGEETLDEKFFLQNVLQQMAAWHGPVSYTHLDVYKRQFGRCREPVGDRRQAALRPHGGDLRTPDGTEEP